MNNLEYIESFFEGKPGKAETDAFNSRLATDNDFSRLVDNYKLAKNTIQTYSRQELLARLETIGQGYSLPVYKKTWFKTAVGVFSVLILASALYFFTQNQKSDANSGSGVSKSINNEQTVPVNTPAHAILTEEPATGKPMDNVSGYPTIEKKPVNAANPTPNPAANLPAKSGVASTTPTPTPEIQTQPGQSLLNDNPEVVFYADKQSSCGELTVHFYDSSGIDAKSVKNFSWNFGDDSYSSEQNPVHSYKLAGNYNVELTLTLSDGQNVSAVRNNFIHVYPIPEADFTVSPPLAQLSNARMEFTNLTLNPTSKIFYTWDFGDHSDVSKVKSPVHSYLDTGIFNIVLTARNEFKCQGQVSKSVQVLENVSMFIPTIFNPANSTSSDNSTFKVVSSGITEFHILIFDRKGTLFYESNDYDSHGWNGNTSFGQAPMGSYVYKIKVKGLDGNYYDYKGVISLIR